jgi:hypothetical protein
VKTNANFAKEITSLKGQLKEKINWNGNVSTRVNFGDNLAKPFSYDIKKCPGLNFK